MTTVRRSLLLSLADSYFGLGLQLASTVIIARLLTPAEVGIFAVATAFAALATMFRDFGVAEYLIQERELTDEKIRAALALNIAVSWAMALVMFGAAPLAGRFYGQVGIADVMQVQAFNFLLVPFGAVTLAWFRRELNYRPIVVCNVLSGLTEFGVSVSLVLNGFGYMSLAWASLASIAVAVAVAMLLRPADFPRWPGFKGIGVAFRFGRFASLIYIASQLGKGAPELIIGRARDMPDVGMFSRAGSLVEMVHRLLMRPVLQICLPYLAKADRERGGIQQAYAQSVGYLTAVGWPFLALLGMGAFAFIRLIYGPQWTAAVPVAQLLCLAFAIDLLFLLSKEALLAACDVKSAARLAFGIVGMQVAGLFLVVPFGLVGAATGLVIASVGSAILAQYFLWRVIGLRVRDLARQCGLSAVVGLATLVPLVAWTYLVPITEQNYLVFVFGGGVLTVLVWGTCLRQLRHPMWFEIVRFTSAMAKRWRWA